MHQQGFGPVGSMALFQSKGEKEEVWLDPTYPFLSLAVYRKGPSLNCEIGTAQLRHPLLLVRRCCAVTMSWSSMPTQIRPSGLGSKGLKRQTCALQERTRCSSHVSNYSMSPLVL